MNDNDAGGATGLYATVERDTAGDANSLRVRTFNAAGSQVDTEEDDGFTVTVFC